MGNDFFKFKEFEVCQAKAAMKVCTDACLFGSILPTVNPISNRVLDIGTGTGLLSLMFAQRCKNAEITALEIDCPAYEQAIENVKNSPWRDRIKVLHGDFRKWACNSDEFIDKFDFIFSNPPFFEGDLKSPDSQRNKALHSTELNFSQLVIGVEALLMPNGIFGVLIPYNRREEMIVKAREFGLRLNQEYLVAHTMNHIFFRTIQFFDRHGNTKRLETIFIREANHEYSLKFKELLEPYYLYL